MDIVHLSLHRKTETGCKFDLELLQYLNLHGKDFQKTDPTLEL